jgi:hypothetical protein
VLPFVSGRLSRNHFVPIFNVNNVLCSCAHFHHECGGQIGTQPETALAPYLQLVTVHLLACLGLTEEALAAAAVKVELRPGCARVLSRAAAARVPLRVLSVNWSARFVRAALRLPDALLPPEDSPTSPSADLAQTSIQANELEFINGVSTGAVHPHLCQR